MLQVLWVVLLIVLGALVVFVIRQARVVTSGWGGVHARRSARVLTAILLGSVVGLGMHLITVREREGGRQAFLDSQSRRFDSFISKQHSVVPGVLAGVLVVGATATAYEFVAWAISLAIGSAKKKGAA